MSERTTKTAASEPRMTPTLANAISRLHQVATDEYDVKHAAVVRDFLEHWNEWSKVHPFLMIGRELMYTVPALQRLREKP